MVLVRVAVRFFRVVRGMSREVYSVRQTLQYTVSTARGQKSIGQEVEPEPNAGSGYNLPARAHIHRSRFVQSLGRNQGGSRSQPPRGCPPLSRKACIQPRTLKGDGLAGWTLGQSDVLTAADCWTNQVTPKLQPPSLWLATVSTLVTPFRFLDLRHSRYCFKTNIIWESRVQTRYLLSTGHQVDIPYTKTHVLQFAAALFLRKDVWQSRNSFQTFSILFNPHFDRL